MIRTKDHNLRRALFLAIKTIAVFLAVLCAVQQPLDMIGQVAAADKDYYISELKLFQAKTVEEAKKLCESEGYYCSNKDLDAGTGKELTIKELTEIVARVVGYKGKIEWDPTKPNGTPRKLLDVSKAKALGWTYKTELEDGIRLAYEDFLNNPMRAER